jgi:hypothetical protein
MNVRMRDSEEINLPTYAFGDKVLKTNEDEEYS